MSDEVESSNVPTMSVNSASVEEPNDPDNHNDSVHSENNHSNITSPKPHSDGQEVDTQDGDNL